MKKLWIISLVLFLLSGCQLLSSDVTKLDLRMVAKGDLNLDDNDRPSPLVVRILELRSTQAFENVDFFALYFSEKETLGSDLVASEELELKPGDIKDFKIALHPDSQQVAILAAYRRLDQVNWRLVLPLNLLDKNQQTVILGAKGLAIARP